MLRYINTLSTEQTFIRFQGEQISLEDEKTFLDKRLKAIENKEDVTLLAFYNGQLIGISGIEMKDKIERHLGVFGISVAKKFRGIGIGEELTRLTLLEAENKLAELKIVTLEVISSNINAQNLYKKLGFIQYGLLPKGNIYKGNLIDNMLMYKTLN